MEITIAASALLQEITLPMNSLQKEAADGKREQKLFPRLGMAGQNLRGCILQNCISVHPESEIWLASDEFHQSVAVKITKRTMDIGIIKKISELQSEYLVPVLDYGFCEESFYEIMPYYRNGSIENCTISEETIRKSILPGLINALKILHENQLIHNDIKPENIFWDDRKQKILLGDYGCVSRKGEKPEGYSLSYAAPEILLGNAAQFSTDWTSVGLTLGSLVQNEKIVQAETKTSALKWWERNFLYTKGSETFNQLINGMIQTDVRRRLGPKAAAAWLNNDLAGTENRLRHRRTIDNRKKELVFENPRFIVKDVNGMLLAIEHYWEHFVFLQKQKKIEDFLRSIDEEEYMYCHSLSKTYDAEQTAFLLSYHFSGGQYFIWRGKKYRHLYEMENTWYKDKDAVKTFLLNGSVKFILKKEGSSDEALDYVQELMDMGRLNPEKACNLLFIALRGEERFVWGDRLYASIEDLLEFICQDSDGVDQTVEELLNDKKFQAWMAFQGYGDFAESILKRCRQGKDE